MGSEIKIKSNGLRNELKEIRKSIDKPTNAITMAQTNNRYEKALFIIMTLLLTGCAGSQISQDNGD